MVLAKVLFQQDAKSDAVGMMQETVQEMRDLADQNPQSVSTQQNAAMFDAELAVMQLYTDDFDSAHANFSHATAVLEKLHEESPNDLRIHRELEEALYGLAVTKYEVGDQAEAESLMRQTLEMRREALAKDPTNVQYQLRLLPALARVGELKEGVELALQLDEKLSAEDSMRYHLACGYALLAAASRAKDATEEKDIPFSSRQLVQKSIDCLKDVAEKGLLRKTDLELDPDLDSIREHKEFQELNSKQTT